MITQQQPVPPPYDASLSDSLSLIQLLNLSLKSPDYGVVNFRSLYVLLEYLINRMNVAHDRVDLRERPSQNLIREASRSMAEGGMYNTTNGVVDYREAREVSGLTVGGGIQEPFRTPSLTSFANHQRISSLEQKLGILRMQLEAFSELPTNGRLAEKAEDFQSGGGFTLNIFEPNKGSLTVAERAQSSGLVGSVFDPPLQQASGWVRTSGPIIEAWQVVQLGKRMDAAEQALEKAFSLIDEMLQGVGKIKQLKDNLVNYIRKWMLNPDAAFQDVRYIVLLLFISLLFICLFIFSLW